MEEHAVRNASFAAAMLLSLFGLSSCSNPTLEVLYGNFRFGQGEYTRATISYMRVLSSGDETGVVRYNLANVYYALGETEPAIDTMQEAAAQEGWAERCFRAYYNLGNFCFDLGDFERAVTSYIAALKQKPEDRDAKINLELALKRLDRGAGVAQAGASGRRPDEQTELGEKYRHLLRTAGEKEGTTWEATEQSEPAPDSGW